MKIGSVESLYAEVNRAADRGDRKTADALLAGDVFKAVDNQDLAQEIAKLDADTIKSQLDELKKKPGVDLALVDRIERQLTPENLKRVAATEYAKQSGVTGGKAAKAGPEFAGADRRAEIEARLDQQKARAQAAITADLASGGGLKEKTLSELTQAIATERELVEMLTEDIGAIDSGHRNELEDARSKIAELTPDIERLEKTLSKLEADLAAPETQRAHPTADIMRSRDAVRADLETKKQELDFYQGKVDRNPAIDEAFKEFEAKKQEALSTLHDPAVYQMLVRRLEELEGGKPDLGVEAVLRRYVGGDEFSAFEARVAEQSRGDELAAAIEKLDPALRDFVRKPSPESVLADLQRAVDKGDIDAIADAVMNRTGSAKAQPDARSPGDLDARLEQHAAEAEERVHADLQAGVVSEGSARAMGALSQTVREFEQPMLANVDHQLAQLTAAGDQAQVKAFNAEARRQRAKDMVANHPSHQLAHRLEQSVGQKPDLGTEAAAHRFLGDEQYQAFAARMLGENRGDELDEAISKLDPSLQAFVGGKSEAETPGEILGAEIPQAAPEIQAKLEREGLHEHASRDGIMFLERLAGSEKKARKWAEAMGWGKEPGKIDEMIAWGNTVLNASVPGLKDGELLNLRDLFKADAIKRDAKSEELGTKSRRFAEQNLTSYARVLASSMVINGFADPDRAKSEFHDRYTHRRAAVKRVSRPDPVNFGRNVARMIAGKKPQERLTPEQKEKLDQNPALRTAMEDLWRAEDDLDSMNAQMLVQMRSLLRSGMPIDKLMVAIMLLLTMREERKFKKTVAETGAIEQVEKTNNTIRRQKQRADTERNKPAGSEPSMSPEELERIDKLEEVEPVEFGLSPKSHHIMTQELQASLQFFQQMLQTLSQVLKVWQDLVDSILQRWR